LKKNHTDFSLVFIRQENYEEWIFLNGDILYSYNANWGNQYACNHSY